MEINHASRKDRDIRGCNAQSLKKGVHAAEKRKKKARKIEQQIKKRKAGKRMLLRRRQKARKGKQP